MAGNLSHLGDVSERAYSDDRRSRKTCNDCHGRFDPLAYGFERFDGIGRYREVDEHGNQLRMDGWVTETAAGKERHYDDVEQYMQILGESEAVQMCVTKKHLELFLGRPTIWLIDGPVIEEIHEQYVDGGQTYAALVTAIVEHPEFATIYLE